MKKLIATAVLLFGSVSAFAAPYNNATASLSHIEAKYLSGEAVSLLSPYLSSSIGFNGNSIDGQHFYDSHSTSYPDHNAYEDVYFSGVGEGSGSVVGNPGGFIAISSYAIAHEGQVDANTNVLTYLDYKANSVLHITANALIGGVAYDGIVSEWDASALISVGSYDFENGVWSDTNYRAQLSSSSFWSAYNNANKQLNIYYYNTVDTRLSVQFSTYASAALVPEPSTYAMLGLGLGLLGVAARRRKSA